MNSTSSTGANKKTSSTTSASGNSSTTSASNTSSNTKSSSTTSNSKTSKTSGSTTSSTSTTSSSSSSSTSSSSSSGQLGLATLTLRGTILTIAWADAAADVTVNLNLYVAYKGGKLEWASRGSGGFRTKSDEKTIRMEGTFLVASCHEDSSGPYAEVRLDLGGYIIFNSVTKLFGPTELTITFAGAEKIVESSRSLLDITLISSFKLSKLLDDPAFKGALTEVSERAESDAHDQRLAVMNKMSEEVEEIKTELEELKTKLEEVVTKSKKATEDMKNELESISHKSTERFQREMKTLVDAVAAMAMKAVYAQIHELQLKVLSVQQQEVYEQHWPPPPYAATQAAPVPPVP
ncbi:hypothetical protein C8F01DRAFT_1311061 [Mycena amicta]|nr:hypothetical protein C8F01DRAFT_1311061 [Mycena amicta]